MRALPSMIVILLAPMLLILSISAPAHAVTSAELYTSASYRYGRFEANIRFAPGSGVVSSFFLWKDGSELAGIFWNELDFEKLASDCHLELNSIYGDPQQNHNEKATAEGNWCDEYHTYAYEWTPDYIAWLIDGVEVRRDTGAAAAAYADNAAEGMQIRFNIWPGDASFGGTFDPAILPVYQFIDWVQYSSFEGGDFTLEWREDFDGAAVPPGWSLGSWPSPKNNSTHSSENVGIVDGYAVLGLTADEARGVDAALPNGPPVAVTSTTGTSQGNDSPGNDYGDGPGCGCRMAQRSPFGASGLGLLLGALVLGCRRLSARGMRDQPEYLA